MIEILGQLSENLDTEGSLSKCDLTNSCQSSSSSIILNTTLDPNQVDKKGRRTSNESSCDSNYLQLDAAPLSHTNNSFTDTECLEKGLSFAGLHHDIVLTELSGEYSSVTKDEHLAMLQPLPMPMCPVVQLKKTLVFTSVSGHSPSQMHKVVDNSSENTDSGFSRELKD